MRELIIMVLTIGFLGSMATQIPSRRSSSSTQQIMVGNPGGEQGEASRSETPAPADGSVQLKREANGHFYADVEINGTPVRMLVDTGATAIALSRDDARKAGIATSIGMPNVVGEGADGSVHGEYVTIDRMALGETTAEQMHAVVLNAGGQSLLGQEFLQKFAAVEIHGDTMTLR
jgi:aspartyl protease family protein